VATSEIPVILALMPLNRCQADFYKKCRCSPAAFLF